MVYRGKVMVSVPSALQWFVDTGVVSEVVRVIKSGKESQVFLTRRFCGDRVFYFAAKVHKARTGRSFKRDKVYRDGWLLSGRVQKAVSQGTRFGREVIESLWVTQEFDSLRKLWKNGADVPAPILRHENVILMVYIGDPDEPAPKLCEASLDFDEASQTLDELLRNLKIFLKLSLVHGDLSPFNILYWKGKAWIIDLPQSVDLYRNPHAMDLLYRDLQCVCNFFLKQGVDCAPRKLFSQILGVPYVPNRTYQELLMLSAESELSTISCS
jgi:RIO kinase 1